MERPRLTLAVVVLAIVAGLLGLSQYLQSWFAARVFDEWMSTTCTVGGKGEIQKKLRSYGSRLEPKLEQAFLRGPSKAEEAHWRQAALRDWEEITGAIRGGKTHGLAPQEINRFQSRGADWFASSAVADYTEAYRSAAIAGLGILATEPAVGFLKQIQANPRHRQFWPAAGLALMRTAGHKTQARPETAR